MAFVTQCTCHTCGRSWTGAVGSGERPPKECADCKTNREDQERREYFSGLDGLTVEDRLRKLEEWVYNYRPPKTGPTLF